MTKELLLIGNSSTNLQVGLFYLTLIVCRFYMYKLPKEDGKEAHYQGDSYLLLEKGNEGWTNGKGTVNDTTGALGETVGQLYSQGKVCMSVCLTPSSISHKKGILRIEKVRSEIYFADGGRLMCWFYNIQPCILIHFSSFMALLAVEKSRSLFSKFLY